jgi:hypothetical protein
MAAIQMHEALGEYTWLPDLFDEASLASTSHSDTSFTMEDASGNTIIFTGTNFVFNGDVPTAGVVTGVVFENSSNEVLIDVTGGNYKLAKLFATLSSGDLFNLFTALRAGNDTVTGSGIGDDILVGNDAGNDRILGGDGDDYVKAHAGKNRYDGGEGFDTLSFDESIWDKKHAKDGLILNVVKGTAENPWGGKDKFENFEEYLGSHRADKMIGSGGQDRFSGMGGKDVLNGGKGRDDEARYHQEERYEQSEGGIKVNLTNGTVKDTFGAVDKLVGIERVSGTSRDDIFVGGKKEDRFEGREGTDSFNGKGGVDAIGFNVNTDNGIDIDLTLASGQVKDDGFGNIENATSIEAVSGSRLDDTIKLGSAVGWAWGGEGEDILISGTGKQHLEGAQDADTFAFLTAAGIGMQNAAHDEIGDFSQSDGDTIDMSDIAAFVFVGEDAFSGNAIELRFEQLDGNTFVYGDTDADGDADFALELKGEIDLLQSDFVLA